MRGIISKQLFGTDGIRGIAGEYPLDPYTIFWVGQALAKTLAHHGGPRRVLIGEDPRESSHWIAETLAAGLQAEGVQTHSAGVITTPGIAYLARAGRFAAGVMISASHNPYRDNGIKVFAHSGYKLPDEQEHEVEAEIFELAGKGQPDSAPPKASLRPDTSLVDRYIGFLCDPLPPGRRLEGLRMVLDCANGSASVMASEIFDRLKAKVTLIHAQPDGHNINLDCGSLHVSSLQRSVVEAGADLGVAFDGDADRALFVCASGEVVNGDGVLLLAARHLRRHGQLKKDLVVGTSMSNLGLEHTLAREGIRLLRAQVGDKYVLEAMLSSGANLGGEQSGHVIFSDVHTTGDGLLTAIRVAQIVVESGGSLSKLVEELTVYPQVIRNVRVREKVPFDRLPEVRQAIAASERDLRDTGRVIVRYSGTETVVRIMVEAQDPMAVEKHAASIAEAIERSLGVGL